MRVAATAQRRKMAHHRALEIEESEQMEMSSAIPLFVSSLKSLKPKVEVRISGVKVEVMIPGKKIENMTVTALMSGDATQNAAYLNCLGAVYYCEQELMGEDFGGWESMVGVYSLAWPG
jgi:hypothetical protein